MTPTKKSNSFSKFESEPTSVQITAKTDERIALLEAKVEALIEILNNNPNVTEYCQKNVDGVRRINI